MESLVWRNKFSLNFVKFFLRKNLQKPKTENKALELRGNTPHFQRITPRTVRFFMVKKGGSSGKGNSGGQPTVETLAKPKGAKLSISGILLRRQELAKQFLQVLYEQTAAKDFINKKFAEKSKPTTESPVSAKPKTNRIIGGESLWPFFSFFFGEKERKF